MKASDLYVVYNPKGAEDSRYHYFNSWTPAKRLAEKLSKHLECEIEVRTYQHATTDRVKLAVEWSNDEAQR